MGALGKPRRRVPLIVETADHGALGAGPQVGDDDSEADGVGRLLRQLFEDDVGAVEDDQESALN